MKSLKYYKEAFRVKFREYMNPIIGPFRRRLLKCKKFTIISNNCWGGHVYRYFNMKYLSPTIGLYFYAPDYIKFCQNLKQYINTELKFIPYTDSKYCDDLVSHGNTNCPIGKLDDIEIIFLHYSSSEEALRKWNRRKQRIIWDNLFFKMTEQNFCSRQDLKDFESLPYRDKFVFTTRDYGLSSQVIFEDYYNQECVKNDTVNFRKYINLIRFFNHRQYRKRQVHWNEVI